MIFITGTARSGTSLTTQILEKHGLSLGREGGSVNSLYENTHIREYIVKSYLKGMGADPLGQNPLPEIEKMPPDPLWREKIIGMMNDPKEPWGYKCAKLVLIWPLWAEHFPDAKYVIVRRDREKIIDSCMRTGFMRNHNNREGWGNWVDEHLMRIDDMKKWLDCLEVWPEKYIEDPESFRATAEFCGLEFDPDIVVQCVDRNQWHGG